MAAFMRIPLYPLLPGGGYAKTRYKTKDVPPVLPCTPLLSIGRKKGEVGMEECTSPAFKPSKQRGGTGVQEVHPLMTNTSHSPSAKAGSLFRQVRLCEMLKLTPAAKRKSANRSLNAWRQGRQRASVLVPVELSKQTWTNPGGWLPSAEEQAESLSWPRPCWTFDEHSKSWSCDSKRFE